jgi:ubiquinone/menaquinone biosynthesis C-methylase UbiE
MRQQTEDIEDMGAPIPPVSHPVAARVYDWMAGLGPMRRFLEPLRRDVVERAQGMVIEVGAGSGLNFAYYDPERVARVVAVEPDAAMLRLARGRAARARAPIELVRAPVEALPFPDARFDSAVATLVFCSVFDPLHGLREVRRVLKPGGILLLVEHVRASSALAARVQDLLVPVTTRLFGNCHWNRDAESTLRHAGFAIDSYRLEGGGLQPIIVVQAMPSRGTGRDPSGEQLT